MIDLREKFQNLPEIQERLVWVWWNEDTGRYCDTGKHPSANATFLNGAWWAFQEQQNKIRFKDSCVKNLKLQLENKHIDCEISDACCLRLRTKLDDILNVVHKHQYSNGERILKEVKTIYDK